MGWRIRSRTSTGSLAQAPVNNVPVAAAPWGAWPVSLETGPLVGQPPGADRVGDAFGAAD